MHTFIVAQTRGLRTSKNCGGARYVFGDSVHYAGFSLAGSYYDCCLFQETFEHHFINVVIGYITDGDWIRTLAVADVESEVAGMDSWRTVLIEKSGWVRDQLFGGLEFIHDGFHCTDGNDCRQGEGVIE